MKRRLQGFLAGIIVGAFAVGGLALAKSSTEYIEVLYNNIKVYKDNVLCELKDANGTVIEPFIYNGTTYMPVRGTANLADMEVTWDGNTKSVYLWDETVPDDTYLMDVCPPYETKWYGEFLQEDGKYFNMSGNRYTNGFVLNQRDGYALFNLNSKYSSIEFTVGHVDDTNMKDGIVSFFVDGRLIKEITVGAEDMPKTVLIPVSYGLQLKILRTEGLNADTGFGNITVRK